MIQTPRKVKLVQLSPEQLKRLPQETPLFDSSSSLINPSLDPLAPPSPDGLLGSLPPLPPLPDNFLDSALPLPSFSGPSVIDSPPPLPSLPNPPASSLPAPPPSSFGEPMQIPELSGSLPPPEAPVPNATPSPNPTPNAANPNPASTTSPTTGSTLKPLIEDIRERQKKYAYNPEGTSEESKTDNLKRFVESKVLPQANNESDPQKLLPKKLEIPFRYPKTACSRKGHATVATLVNPQGQIVSAELVESSGYEILNDAALQAVQGHGFAATGASQSFLIGFPFDPASACATLSPAKVTPSRSAPIPTPTLTPSPAPPAAVPSPASSAPAPAVIPSPSVPPSSELLSPAPAPSAPLPSETPSLSAPTVEPSVIPTP
jgi:TonB family protein